MRARARHPGLHDASGNQLPHRLVDVGGVDTYVVDAGEGPPVLLIHGYGDTADGWRCGACLRAFTVRLIATGVQRG